MEKNDIINAVKRAQSGDSDAIGELYQGFYDSVYYFAKKTVKDDDLALDITQETFLEVIRTINSLKAPEAFSTWLRQITYHQCTRYFRKSKDVLIEENEEGYSILDTMADESEDSIPQEVYEKKEFRETVLSMVDKLTEEQRAVVVLYYYDELPVKKIAEIQGVSEGTVKSRLNYARKALRCSVEDYEEKTGIKLHGISLLPLITMFLGEPATVSAANAALIGEAVSSAAGTTLAATTATTSAASATTAAATTTSVASSTAAATAATTSVASSTAAAATAATGAATATTVAAATSSAVFASLGAKITAGILAATLAIGGGAAIAINSGDSSSETYVEITETQAESVYATITEDTVNIPEGGGQQMVPSCLKSHKKPTVTINGDTLTITNHTWQFEESNPVSDQFIVKIDGQIIPFRRFDIMVGYLHVEDTYEMSLLPHTKEGKHTITIETACVTNVASGSIDHGVELDDVLVTLEYTRGPDSLSPETTTAEETPATPPAGGGGMACHTKHQKPTVTVQPKDDGLFTTIMEMTITSNSHSIFDPSSPTGHRFSIYVDGEKLWLPVTAPNGETYSMSEFSATPSFSFELSSRVLSQSVHEIKIVPICFMMGTGANDHNESTEELTVTIICDLSSDICPSCGGNASYVNNIMDRHEYKCQKCGFVYGAEDHTWDDGVYVDNDDIEVHEFVYTCTVCGRKETRFGMPTE